MEKTIRIYISGHKPCVRAESGIVRPILQKEIIRALEAGSDEDRFMAARANEFCELLTQYWAWKTCDADYIGFGHYRRYFVFADGIKPSGDGIVRCLFLNGETASELKLADDSAIVRALENCDVLAPYPVRYPVGSAYVQFKNADALQIEDLDIILDIIEREFPAYAPAARKYMRGRELFYCNMFVLRRDLFVSYSEWLFAILRRFYERKDMRGAGYNSVQLRTPGHLGERLFGIWLTHCRMQGGYKIRFCRMAVFEHAEEVTPLQPIPGAVPFFLPVTPRSVPFVAVALRSAATGTRQPLDAVLLENGISGEDREKLAACVRDRADVTLRFYDAARIFTPCASARGEVRFAYAAIPSAFPAFGGMLWADGYSIFTQDIAQYRPQTGIVDISERGGRLPEKAKKQFYPSGRFPALFTEIFRQTPFYAETDRAKRYGGERNPVWRAVFYLFPDSTRTGSFLRKARRHMSK